MQLMDLFKRKPATVDSAPKPTTQSRTDYHVTWPQRWPAGVLLAAEYIETSLHVAGPYPHGMDLALWLQKSEVTGKGYKRQLTQSRSWSMAMDGPRAVANVHDMSWGKAEEDWGTISELTIWVYLQDTVLARVVLLTRPEFVGRNDTMTIGRYGINYTENMYCEVV